MFQPATPGMEEASNGRRPHHRRSTISRYCRKVYCRDPFMGPGQRRGARRIDVPQAFTDITLPKNSAMGIILCVSGGLIAFGLVWYMWWLVAASPRHAAFAAIVENVTRVRARQRKDDSGTRSPAFPFALARRRGHEPPHLPRP